MNMTIRKCLACKETFKTHGGEAFCTDCGLHNGNDLVLVESAITTGGCETLREIVGRTGLGQERVMRALETFSITL